MSRPLTIKQDKACQEYIECGDKSEAYRRSYNAKNMKPETINRNAFSLFEDSKIITRVEELQEKYRKKYDVTIDDINDLLDRAIGYADKKKCAGDLTTATMGKAKVNGLIIDRKVVSSNITLTEKDGLIAQRYVDRVNKKAKGKK